MKSLTLITIFMIVILFSAGCNLSEKRNGMYRDSDLAGIEPTQKTGEDRIRTASLNSEQQFSSIESRMIIQSGTVKIETDDFETSEKKLTETAKKYSGFITNSSSESGASGKKSGTVTVRIPSGIFQAFLSEISQLGKILSQDISAKDVTEEYIDLEARQRTQKELESRLLDLLNQKTGKLTDIIEVEEKLSSVREKIESTEGRINYLKNRSEYSTLEIMFYEPAMLQTSSGGGFFYEIEQGFKKGLKGFTEILSGLIMITVSLSHIIIFLIIMLLIARRYFKKRSLSNSQLAG